MYDNCLRKWCSKCRCGRRDESNGKVDLSGTHVDEVKVEVGKVKNKECIGCRRRAEKWNQSKRSLTRSSKRYNMRGEPEEQDAI
jgi:hypothetical protein